MIHLTSNRWFTLCALGVTTALVAGCGAHKTHEERLRGMSASPDSGPVTGGTQVTLTLRGFPLEDGVTVTFGGEPAQVVSHTEDTVVVITPPSATEGLTWVRVTQNGPGTLEMPRRPYTYTAAGTPPGSTGGGSTGGGGTTTPPATGAFSFLPGTDKWWIAIDHPQWSDADQDGTDDIEQVLQFAADDQGGQGAWSGQQVQATDIMMSYIAQYYLNNPDGSMAVGGVPLSMQQTEPTVGATPASGSSDDPTSTDDYNVMALHHLGGTGGTTGRAISDTSGSNRRLENDSGINGGTGNSLGTFVDRMTQFWNSGGIATSQRTLDSYMRMMAVTCAHEIGHSCGLEHRSNQPLGADVNIMAPSSTVDPSLVFAFDDATIRFLKQVMPGNGRCQHGAAWTPRWLVAEADAVVIGEPLTLADGRLTLMLHEVLVGDLQAGERFEVTGFGQGLELSADQLAETGRSVWFLQAADEGFRFVGAEAEVVTLAGRDEAEWAALIRDYALLGDMRGGEVADQAAYTARIARSLTSTDLRIRNSALLELSLDRGTVRSLTEAELAPVAAIVADANQPAEVRALGLQTFVHRADAAQVELLAEVALGADDARVLQAAAGALEMSLGLSKAGQFVLQRAALGSDMVQARARVVLGWLQCQDAVSFVAADLTATDAQRVRAAANALGLIGDAGALSQLQQTALDVQLDTTTRNHVLRAIGRIGGEGSQWLTEQLETATGDEADALRFARDYARTWINL
jgi:IPT/TIG domain